MSLQVKSGDVPKNAVILTRTEALDYQWQQIISWKPKSDVWPFTHGLGFLGGIAALSGAYINLKFRKAMRLKDFGRFASITTTSICPGVLAGLFQLKYVAEKIFLPIETCPLCIELRSIAIQNSTAVIYPVILVPITNFMLALRGQTHRIPHYTNWRELLFFCNNLYKPMLPALAVIGVANSIAACFLLRQQIKCLSYVRDVLDFESEADEDAYKFQ